VWLWLHAAVAMIPIVMADDDRRLSAVPDTAVLAFDSSRRLGETFGDLSAVPRGLLILAVSLLALRAHFLPRWITYFGLIIATASLICIIGPVWWIAPFGTAALIGLFGFLIWLMLVSATLLREKRDLELSRETHRVASRQGSDPVAHPPRGPLQPVFLQAQHASSRM
jgi:hypothetical protein